MAAHLGVCAGSKAAQEAPAAASKPRRVMSLAGDEVLLRLRFYDVGTTWTGRVEIGLTDEHMDELVPFETTLQSRWHDVIETLDVSCSLVGDGVDVDVPLVKDGSRWRGVVAPSRTPAGRFELRAKAAAPTDLRALDVLPTALEVGDGSSVVIARDVAVGASTFRVRETYGAGVCHTVWNGGVLLSAYLTDIKRRRGLDGKTVVDLGSGTGLVGAVAASLGAVAWVTDQGDALDGLLDTKARYPDLNVAPLSFGQAPTPDLAAAAPTIAFAADVLYLGADIVPLIAFSLYALPTVEELYVAHTYRDETSTEVLQLLMDALHSRFPHVSVGLRVENMASHHSVVRFRRTKPQTKPNGPARAGAAPP